MIFFGCHLSTNITLAGPLPPRLFFFSEGSIFDSNLFLYYVFVDIFMSLNPVFYLHDIT